MNKKEGINVFGWFLLFLVASSFLLIGFFLGVCL